MAFSYDHHPKHYFAHWLQYAKLTISHSNKSCGKNDTRRSQSHIRHTQNRYLLQIVILLICSLWYLNNKPAKQNIFLFPRPQDTAAVHMLNINLLPSVIFNKSLNMMFSNLFKWNAEIVLIFHRHKLCHVRKSGHKKVSCATRSFVCCLDSRRRKSIVCNTSQKANFSLV